MFRLIYQYFYPFPAKFFEGKEEGIPRQHTWAVNTSPFPYNKYIFKKVTQYHPTNKINSNSLLSSNNLVHAQISSAVSKLFIIDLSQKSKKVHILHFVDIHLKSPFNSSDLYAAW